MSEPYWIPLAAAPAAPSAITNLFDLTLGAAAPSISIPSIPQTYAHLKLMGLLRGDSAGVAYVDMRIQFNGDTGANYDSTSHETAGATVTGREEFAQPYIRVFTGLVAATAPAGRASPFDFSIPYYANAVFTKSLIGPSAIPYGTSGTTNQLKSLQGHWRGVAPITSILVFPASGNFVAGSRLTLYGLI